MADQAAPAQPPAAPAAPAKPTTMKSRVRKNPALKIFTVLRYANDDTHSP
jgi:hypothetical protein